MPYPNGAVQLSSFIGTTGQADPYPTHLDYMGLGGHRAVATIAERDAIISQRRAFGMLVTVNADPTAANNKTYMLANVKLGGVNNTITDNANWKEFTAGSNFNFTGGPKSLYSDPTTGQITDFQYTTTRLLDSFTGSNFDEKLRYACLNAPNGTIIDCTRYQGQTEVLTETVNITKSVKLLFPSMTIVYYSDGGVRDHMFWIKADGVTIEGTGRSSKKDTVSSTYANTQFHMLLPNGHTQNGGYHISNENITPDTVDEAYNVVTLKGFDCIGVEQVYGTSGAPNNTIVTTTYGAGGICIVEGNPFVSGGGNAVNQVYIENVFVWKTRDHGILLLGAILAQVINCRVSNAAGHGFYLGGTCVEDSSPFTLGGSTSTYFVNCYASSGKLAGFCAHSASYSQFQNCAAEFFGMGYFLRSAFNVSLFGCGAEQNDVSEQIPVNLGIQFYAWDGVIGNAPVLKTLDDVGGSTYTGRYKGSSLYIGGGRNLYIPNFFSTEPGNSAGDTIAPSTQTTHITVYAEARAVYIVNPRLTGTSPVVNPIRIERTTGSSPVSPRDVNLFFNPEDDRPSGSFFTSAPNITLIKNGSTSACDSIILDQGLNTEIKNGSTYYRPWFYTPNSVYTPTTPYKALLATDANNEVFPLVVPENVYVNVNYSVSGAGYEVYASPIGGSNLRGDVIVPTLLGQTKRILGLSISNISQFPVGLNTLQIYLSNSGGDTLLYTVTSSSPNPVSVDLPSPVSITGTDWCLKLVTTGVYTTQVGVVALRTVNY